MNHRRYSPELAQRIVKRIKQVGCYETAARAVGISPHTLATWMRRLPEFRMQCQQAKANAESVFYN